MNLPNYHVNCCVLCKVVTCHIVIEILINELYINCDSDGKRKLVS